MANVTELEDATFTAEVLQAETPVLVDFWAPWCAPCRAMSPAVNQLAEEFEGKLKVCKLNTQEYQQAASINGVMALPTFIVFKDGEEAAKQVGGMSFEDLKALVESVI